MHFDSTYIFVKDRVRGNPFIFQEVIDKGAEPITAGEYLHLGKVTEFRVCDWLASCIRKNDFNCLKDFGKVMTYIVVKFFS